MGSKHHCALNPLSEAMSSSGLLEMSWLLTNHNRPIKHINLLVGPNRERVIPKGPNYKHVAETVVPINRKYSPHNPYLLNGESRERSPSH